MVKSFRFSVKRVEFYVSFVMLTISLVSMGINFSVRESNWKDSESKVTELYFVCQKILSSFFFEGKQHCCWIWLFYSETWPSNFKQRVLKRDYLQGLHKKPLKRCLLKSLVQKNKIIFEFVYKKFCFVYKILTFN